MPEALQRPTQTSPHDDADLKAVLTAKRSQLVNDIEAIDADLAEAQRKFNEELEEARRRRQPLEEALLHVDALLGLGIGGLAMKEEARVSTVKSVESAHSLLAERGKPLHYRELAAQLTRKGAYLSGKDPAATLLSQMSRDARFKRGPERGTYGLAGWRMGSKKRAIKRKAPRRTRK